MNNKHKTIIISICIQVESIPYARLLSFIFRKISIKKKKKYAETLNMWTYVFQLCRLFLYNNL